MPDEERPDWVWIPPEYKPEDFKIVHFAPWYSPVESLKFIEMAKLEATMKYQAEIMERLARDMLDSLSHRMARCCASGHVHDTYEGRIFCDASKGFL
jgi:hypothetical protein